jgi:hypothetical protein
MHNSTLSDAKSNLGDARTIRESFIDFQAHLYSGGAA